MLSPDPHEHLDDLRIAYQGGDPFALLQVVRFSQRGIVALPIWAVESLQGILSDIMTGPLVGTKGRGNAAFGAIRKGYIRSVRARTYRGVRAWQKNPHNYFDLPRAAILDWYKEPKMWSQYTSYSDAESIAERGLRGTAFQARPATVRKAAYQMPMPVKFGRYDLELALGLRGPTGLLGPPTDELPANVKLFLKKHPVVE